LKKREERQQRQTQRPGSSEERGAQQRPRKEHEGKAVDNSGGGDRKRKAAEPEGEGEGASKKQLGGRREEVQHNKRKESDKEKQTNAKRQREDNKPATQRKPAHGAEVRYISPCPIVISSLFFLHFGRGERSLLTVQQPKRGKTHDDSIAAALRAPTETAPKKERLTKAKKEKQENDKFDELVERYKQRTQGVNTDGWL
jgi:hypothetical protein